MALSTTLPGFLFLASVIFSVSPQAIAQSPAAANLENEGEALLRCGEITDVTQLSLCLSKAVSQAKKKTAAAGYGYPHRIAPPLPPFLRSDNPSANDIEAERRVHEPTSTTLVKRIQIYSEPGYRNFLDLDATVSQRVMEYRPIFGDFPVPVVLHHGHPSPPTVTSSPYQEQRNEYYHKPVKPRNYRKKAYGDYPKKGIYQQPGKEYNGYNKAHQKYSADEYSRQQYKSTGYDQEYYVPANSPIIGDIRRSLLDYTGAKDLMSDEGDYLSSGPILRQRIKEIGTDYYPFRRSDVFVKDLEADESHKRNHRP